MSNIDVEILAPAGSFESMKAAINAGADAVYIGGSRFGARAYADNPEEDMLISAINYVHLFNRKIYLTVNTLLKNTEISQLYDYLKPYYEAGLDAVIVQDMGVFKCIHEWFPDMDIHASTQMVITGVDGARLLKKMGASRVVTARELSTLEIKSIHEACNIEIESFVHGALCYCYSGQCLMSSMLGGRSGNRGRCAQPCRLPYDVMHKGKVINKDNEKYILSPKDMCTIRLLPEIIKAGVYSLKIEGRMKSPEYTAGVVAIYRKYVDLLKENGFDNYRVSDEDYQRLEQIYSRSGFSDGYYNQHNGKNMMTFSKPSYSGQSESVIADINDKYIKSDMKLPISGNITICENKDISLTVTHNNYEVTVNAGKPLQALNRPINKEMVIKQMNKTGSTSFVFDNLNINISGNVFVQVKELNELRRLALLQLEEKILSTHRREAVQKPVEININAPHDNKLELICMVNSEEQLSTAIVNKDVSWVYVSMDYLHITQEQVNYAHSHNTKIAMVMPYVFRWQGRKYFNEHLSEINQLNIDAVVIRNVDELSFAKENMNDIPVIYDYYVYNMNDYAYSQLYEFNPIRITQPLEINYKELRNRKTPIGEIVVYGYTPIMVTAGCVNKNVSVCDKTQNTYYLKDRYNTQFRVENICRYCYNLIYNSVPISLLSVSDEIKSLDVQGIRLQFTSESSNETENIINKFANKFLWEKDIAEIDNSTRGHFKRGVE